MLGFAWFWQVVGVKTSSEKNSQIQNLSPICPQAGSRSALYQRKAQSHGFFKASTRVDASHPIPETSGRRLMQGFRLLLTTMIQAGNPIGTGTAGERRKGTQR
jgi:hypothetical protein